ncbi:MAG: MspA family porin [Segniliparus sp.]|uniref:MspA family porin n=1 Tax=Segniliparus sp. TaxID=2804064 RepID=UPI003F39996B
MLFRVLSDRTPRVLRRRSSVLAAVVLASGAAGSAACADPVGLEDVTEHHVTDDGYDVALTLSEMSVTSVANMAQTPFTREAFVSARASVDIAGTAKVPVNTGLVKLGLQASCQIDLSNGLEINGGASMNATTPDANIQAGVQGVGTDTGTLNPGVNGYMDTYLKPGQIVTVPVSVKQLAGRDGATRVLNEHVNVDACGGPAFVRPYAVVQVSTPTNDDTFTIYGPIAPF